MFPTALLRMEGIVGAGTSSNVGISALEVPMKRIDETNRACHLLREIAMVL